MAELVLRNRVLKKKLAGAGGGEHMERLKRYSASEKLELIRLVEGASLSMNRTLAELDIPRSTFYRW